MMGYGRIDQKTAGIHLRLWARAFVIATPCNGKRVVLVSADVGQVFQVIKQQVMARLQTAYGSTYTDANVILSATHTHSGPGGDSHYALYNLTILGFDQQNLDTVVHGIYQAIVRAHTNLGAGTITVASGDLTDASINRSRALPGAGELLPRRAPTRLPRTRPRSARSIPPTPTR